MIVPVIQDDREAAASGYFCWIASNPVVPNKMLSGVLDEHSMVQAFARHRIKFQREYDL